MVTRSSVCPSTVWRTTDGPLLKNRKPPWIGSGSSKRPSEMRPTVPVTVTGAPCSASVLPPSVSVRVAPAPAATHAATASGSRKVSSRLRTPSRCASARMNVESPALPAPTLSPTSSSTTGPRGAPRVLERLAGRQAGRGCKVGSTRPGTFGHPAGRRLSRRQVTVGDGVERGAHLLHIRPRIALGHAGVDDPRQRRGLLHIRDDAAHRLLAGVLTQDADDHRRHLQRSDGMDFAANRAHQDVAGLDRPLLRIHMRIGAVHHDRLGKLSHLSRNVGVQVKGHDHRHVGADDRAGPGGDFAVDIRILLRHGGTHLVEQDAVPRSTLLEELHHLTDDLVEGVPLDRAARVVDGEEQRHELEVQVVGGLKVAGEGGVGAALIALDLLAAQHTAVARGAERRVRGGKRRERVGLVVQTEGGDPRTVGSGHLATQPPSTGSATPVRNEALSEQSHTTAAAISSGVPSRPTGSPAINICSVSGRRANTRSSMGVRIPPGHTAFTRIPRAAYSSAATFVSPTTPCLAALYAPPKPPTRPAMDAVLTIAPARWVSMWVISTCMQSQTPLRLMASTRSHISSG